MAQIEDYALIGDMQTAGLVSREGSIDWLCLPYFDSASCFASLLGTPDHGRWLIAPAVPVRSVSRRYRGATLVLETIFETDAGVVRVIDCMPPREQHPDVVRIVEGVRGEVPMRMELIVRFDYGSIVPWVRRMDGELRAIGGPDALSFWSPVETKGVGLTTQAEFVARPGESVPFVIMWHPSHVQDATPIDGLEAVAATEAWWKEWGKGYTYDGPWPEQVLRSVITIKALTFAPTGGIVAAATTSLPEKIGGVRNWDYRYCWLRDAALSLNALIICGYTQEAAAWRNWLVRAVAGEPSRWQIMYGLSGERRLMERELPWLPGYEGSRPVRTGNAAFQQRQLDVYGQVMDALYVAHSHGLEADGPAWDMQRAMLEFLEDAWTEPDEGIWEVRGPKRHFTHSKMMAWVAFDRAVKMVEQFGADGPVDRWRAVRDQVHAEVCARGYDARRNTFTQFYGSRELDASLLLMPLVGFLPADDTRVRGTVAAIERELMVDGFVHRYRTSPTGEVDGLPDDEGAFLPCSFWLADNYVLQGRRAEAHVLCERLLAIANDVGLLSEQYDPRTKRQLGNFPQAFSHVALINTSRNLVGRPQSSGERR